jgi:RNA-directed DNA polymerase
LSVVLSNIYLDKLDKELEQRGLRFVRYADDVLIFTKSEMAANHVMKSINNWIERKLFLKINATKPKVVRPTRNKYLKRGKAISRSLVVTIKRVNQMVVGWINYFRIGMMNGFNNETIYKVANSRLGWYRRCGMNVVNFILSPELLETKVKDGADLLNPLQYYLRNVGI